VKVPSWWPPTVGSKLRHFTLHTDPETGLLVQVHALVHVVAVFEHAGESLATIAEWLPTRRRWIYETILGWLQNGESYWPDGQEPSKPHGSPGRICVCCQKPGT